MAESTLSSPMEALQLAGKIIMENGGETYRAEETICRMGGGFGLSEVESFAVPTGLFISYRNAEGTLGTSIKRVRRSGRNLTRVNEANRISRLVSAGQMDCAEALKALKEIEQITFTKVVMTESAIRARAKNAYMRAMMENEYRMDIFFKNGKKKLRWVAIPKTDREELNYELIKRCPGCHFFGLTIR